MKKRVFMIIASILCFLLIVSCAVPAVVHLKTRKLLKTIEDNDYEQFQKELRYCHDLNATSYSGIFCHFCDVRASTPLQAACSSGNYQMVSDLIDRGARVDGVYFHAPYSPLMCATMSGSESDLEIVKLLLDKGADASYRKAEHDADALYQLVISRKQIPNAIAIMDLLVQNGGDVYYVHNTSGTLLNLACLEGRDPEIIRHLLEQYGIDPNAGVAGRTALIDYCRQTIGTVRVEAETIQLLLDHGADKNATDETGHTAYDYAVQNAYADQTVLDLLKP